MENLFIEDDIKIIYVTAKSFPEGIAAAFEKLHTYFPFSEERKFYGLSRPENGKGIVYKAAAEALLPKELKTSDLKTMIIPKGNYISETLHNFKSDISVIGKTFEKLLRQPNIDHLGYCVEWYSPNDADVICMVRLKN